MRLNKILKNVQILDKKNFKDYNINTITHISNDVEKDSIFICIKGNNFDGNNYVNEAVMRGAKCIITEEDLGVENVCVIKVDNARKTMSIVAKNFYNNACDDLKLIGVIGTAGKTTTSLIIANLLKSDGNIIGVIGTNVIFIGDVRLENKFTTPDPLELHYIFYQMKLLGVKTVVMEVSAQAIYLLKMFGIKFDICVFTNITPEHLDFFGSMEKYARCKMDFFSEKNMKECVVNVDDFYGMEIAYKCNIPCVTYSVKNPANSFAIDINIGLSETKFTANILDEIIDVRSSLVGDFNVYNILAGITVAKMCGKSCDEIICNLQNLQTIPGRLNYFDKGGKIVIVDFAHTPDSFEKTLSFVKKFCVGEMITLFGCVGYSERNKRKDMGAIADKYSDHIILTTDNICNANFIDVCNDIKSGIIGCDVNIIEDRREAIEYAYDKMNVGDVLCVLGKGAEEFQKIGEERIAYSDLEVVNNFH